MLLALAKKLRNQVQSQGSTEGPVGTLTVIEQYPQLQYGEIDGIGTVTIDKSGNMVGFSPVERCQDKHGEIAWIPTELIRNLRSQPFVFTDLKAGRAARATTEK